MVSKWLRRRTLRRTLFAAVVIVLMTTVGWLGTRVLVQDRQLAGQRVTEDREVAADLVVAAFNQRLSSIERDLDAALSRRDVTPDFEPIDAIVVRISGDAIRTWPANRLRYAVDTGWTSGADAQAKTE
jgi:hypothetical protein